MYQKLLTKVVLYMDQSKDNAKKLKEYIENTYYDDIVPDKVSSKGFEDILTMFNEYSKNTIVILELFDPNIASPSTLEKLFFTAIRNKDFNNLEKLDNTKHFDIKLNTPKDAESVYILGGVGTKIPVMYYTNATIDNVQGNLKIDYFDIKSNTSVNIAPLNKKELISKLDNYIAIAGMRKMKDLGKSDFVKDIQHIDKNIDFNKKIVKYALVLTRVNMILIRETVNNHKALLTMYALNAKMLRKGNDMTFVPKT